MQGSLHVYAVEIGMNRMVETRLISTRGPMRRYLRVRKLELQRGRREFVRRVVFAQRARGAVVRLQALGGQPSHWT
jgi:hypothetical protein